MYVRFIVLAPKPRRPFGLFRAERPLLDDPQLPAWLGESIDQHYKWFNAHLPRPYSRAAKGRGIPVTSLSWFRPEAAVFIARARHLAWLIEEAGHPTAMIKSKHVGQILYRDDAQIVAMPDDRTRLRA